MECLFKVGQAVVCVNGSNTNSKRTQELYEGMVYTIRWVGVYEDKKRGLPPEVCVRVVGVRAWSGSVPFLATRFRPTKETSIEVFKKLLKPIRESTKKLSSRELEECRYEHDNSRSD
jgi:hypothetical protein